MLYSYNLESYWIHSVNIILYKINKYYTFRINRILVFHGKYAVSKLYILLTDITFVTLHVREISRIVSLQVTCFRPIKMTVLLRSRNIKWQGLEIYIDCCFHPFDFTIHANLIEEIIENFNLKAHFQYV